MPELCTCAYVGDSAISAELSLRVRLTIFSSSTAGTKVRVSGRPAFCIMVMHCLKVRFLVVIPAISDSSIPGVSSGMSVGHKEQHEKNHTPRPEQYEARGKAVSAPIRTHGGGFGARHPSVV